MQLPQAQGGLVSRFPSSENSGKESAFICRHYLRCNLSFSFGQLLPLRKTAPGRTGRMSIRVGLQGNMSRANAMMRAYREKQAQREPHSSETNPCPATWESKGACPGYVIDHIKPLACGGENTPDNMQRLHEMSGALSTAGCFKCGRELADKASQPSGLQRKCRT